MPEESFVCQKCDFKFTCEQFLIAHNRFHVKEDRNSRNETCDTADEPRKSTPKEHEIIPRTSIDEINNQRSIRVKTEPCSSTSISNTASSGQNSSIVKQEQHLNIASPALQESNATRNDSFFVCDKCNKCFMCQNQLDDHCQMHIKLEKAGKNILLDSYSDAKLQKRKRCVVCNMHFRNKSERKKHYYAVHGGGIGPSCKECGKMFTKLKKLFRHNRKFHQEKLVKCDVCSKGFTRNIDLKRHYRIHVGENFRAWYETKHELSSSETEPMLAGERIVFKSEPMEIQENIL